MYEPLSVGGRLQLDGICKLPTREREEGRRSTCHHRQKLPLCMPLHLALCFLTNTIHIINASHSGMAVAFSYFTPGSNTLLGWIGYFSCFCVSLETCAWVDIVHTWEWAACVHGVEGSTGQCRGSFRRILFSLFLSNTHNRLCFPFCKSLYVMKQDLVCNDAFPTTPTGRPSLPVEPTEKQNLWEASPHEPPNLSTMQMLTSALLLPFFLPQNLVLSLAGPSPGEEF